MLNKAENRQEPTARVQQEDCSIPDLLHNVQGKGDREDRAGTCRRQEEGARGNKKNQTPQVHRRNK